MMPPVDPPITAGQRRYLAEFDRHLREGTVASRQRMRNALPHALEGKVTIDPARTFSDPISRQPPRKEAPMEQPHTPGPRPVDQVLASAVEELRRREQALLRIDGELRKVRAAIKALEKAGAPKASATRAQSAQAPRGELAASMVQAIRDADHSLSVTEVAEAVGREPAGWLSAQLGRLVEAGTLIRDDGNTFTIAATNGALAA